MADAKLCETKAETYQVKKNEQNTQNICAGQEAMLFAVFEQSIFKVPKKTEESRPRNELPGPKKSDVFLKMMKT